MKIRVANAGNCWRDCGPAVGWYVHGLGGSFVVAAPSRPSMQAHRHGGPYAYDVARCRCDVCRTWHSKRNRKQREYRHGLAGTMSKSATAGREAAGGGVLHHSARPGRSLV